MARVLYRARRPPTVAIVLSVLGAGYAGRALLLHRATEDYREKTAAQQRAIRAFLRDGHGAPAVDWERVRRRVQRAEDALAAAGLGRPTAALPPAAALRASATRELRGADQ